MLDFSSAFTYLDTMSIRNPNFYFRFSTLLILISSFFTSTSVAHYVDIRQAVTPTYASANSTLYTTPNPTTESAADAALDRGVLSFLNNILTKDFLPINGNSICKSF
jgi:hypothetical protein